MIGSKGSGPPIVGFAPKLSDAELVTLAVISALLGYDNESQFVRYARAHLGPWFPYLPNMDDIVLPGSGYWVVLMVMAERFLAGKRPLAV